VSRRGKLLSRPPVRPSVRSHARGVLAENRVLAACCAPERPAWLVSARRASREEDGAGIDIVVESDAGQLLLQVKSSFYGKARFLKEERDARIGVVVVTPYDPQETVRCKVYSALGALRGQSRSSNPARPPEVRLATRHSPAFEGCCCRTCGRRAPASCR
jgi:hypothetical protein